MAGWFRQEAEGLRLYVRLTPKGGADRIEGVAQLADGAQVLVARVKAAAEKGKANAALEKLIAGSLGVAAAQVAVVSGHKARLKTVHVSARAEVLPAGLAALGQQKKDSG